jgi:glycosyltransferase involved in cell wall biosynthesis
MNKKLLIINYYWPPSGGPAVQRWLSLTTELADRGWQIWVLTVDDKYATYQMYDQSLVDKVHPSVQVVKTKTIEPFGFYKLLFGKKSIPAPGFSNEAKPSITKKISRFIRGNFFIPDPRKYWRKFAVKKARMLIEQHDIKTVITAGPPHSTHLTGLSLKNLIGVKWICDFHDLWTDVIYYDLLYHLPHIKKIDKELERKILESCDSILTVGEKYKEKLLSKSPNISPQKIAITRIGYEESLFTEVSRKDTSFVISYIGSIAEYYHPEVFCEALSELLHTDQINNVKLRFVGITNPIIKTFVLKYRLQNIYEEIGYVSHDEAVSYMKRSTILLLINPVTRDEAMVIPGKIYEYLATGNPIINITKKDSETAALIAQCNAGKTFERNELKPLQEYILRLYKSWNEGRYVTEVNKNEVSKFSHAAIAAQLEQHLQSIQ